MSSAETGGEEKEACPEAAHRLGASVDYASNHAAESDKAAVIFRFPEPGSPSPGDLCGQPTRMSAGFGV